MNLTYHKGLIKTRSNIYHISKKLGEGSYGEVFLTEIYDAGDRKDQSYKASVKTLACKVIDTKKASEEYFMKFIPRELDILRKVNHPHIIQVFSIYQNGPRYFIFMRFAENGDLADFTHRTGSIIESQARVWTKQISLALQYLHELEIAHRDIKCENILVTANYNVKLTDFGFARFVMSRRGRRTLSETYCGSKAYCAPEIIKGIPYNPKVADIWSLGVVIFVMVNKAMPFDGATLKKFYEQQIGKRWRFRPSTETVASSQVKNLIENLLEPNVEKRYTIAEVLNSEWLQMDRKLLGLSEGETLALAEAREERKKMDEKILLQNYQGVKREKPKKYSLKY